MTLELRQDIRMDINIKQKISQYLLHDASHPDIPDATKGVEGLIAADKYLKQIGACGIVIGSMAKLLSHSPRSLDIADDEYRNIFESQKDVDIIVLSDKDITSKVNRFQEGIDWWYPVRKKFASAAGNIEETVFVNGHGIVLKYVPTYEDIGDLQQGIAIVSSMKILEEDIMPAIKEAFGEDLSTYVDKIFRMRPSDRKRIPTSKRLIKSSSNSYNDDQIEKISLSIVKSALDDFVMWNNRVPVEDQCIFAAAGEWLDESMSSKGYSIDYNYIDSITFQVHIAKSLLL